MMLIEQTSVPTAALPVQEFKDHLRLGTGFGDDSLQDGVLAAYLRAALAAIEARTGKMLLERNFAWTLTAWRSAKSQGLPVGPISAITALTLIDHAEQESEVSQSAYGLKQDLHLPVLITRGACLPTVPANGFVRVSFTAGFGATWSSVPADLQHAVLLLASNYYEFRQDGAAGDGAIPQAVLSLISRYRALRISAGGAT